MATTAAWGEQIQVFMEVGFPQNPFTLDSATLGVLDGTSFLDGSLLGDDVAEYVQQITITRGRQDQLSVFSAGNASITLLNNDRRFDPTNQSSPYFDPATGQSGVTPRRRVSIYLDNEPVFVGRITDIDLSYATGKSTDLSTVTINVADDFVLLANAATTQDRTPAVELSGDRLSYLLALPEVAYPGALAIDSGTAVLGDYPLTANTNVLSYAQAITTSEQGLFYVSRDGTLTFTDRVAAAFVSPFASFGDDQTTDIKYQELSILYGQEFLYNKVVATRDTGLPQVANDAASQTEYGISTLNLGGLLVSDDTAALALADDLLELYKEPAFRFENMRLHLSSLIFLERERCNQLELGDSILVTRNYQTGSPASVEKTQTVERLRHVITPNSHTLEVAMSDAYVVFPFILDDVTFGVMDTDNALA